jgi:hypothetical protein
MAEHTTLFDDAVLNDLINHMMEMRPEPLFVSNRPARRPKPATSLLVKEVSVDRTTFGRKFCSVLSTSLALDTDMATAEALLTEHAGYDREVGTYDTKLRNFLKEWGWSYVYDVVRLTSKNAHLRLPKECILDFRRHVAYFKDGTIYDSFNTLQLAGCKQTSGYYVRD